MEIKRMNLVNELQVSAEEDDVLTVLRKTKRLASKLDRQDISEWLQAEQDGYPDNFPIPDYRLIRMSLAYDTDGLVPAGFGYLRDGAVDLPATHLNGPVPFTDPISSVLSHIQIFNAGHDLFSPIRVGSE